MKHKERTFEGLTEVVDGNEYEFCEFRNCRIVYHGGPLPQFRYCNFANPQFFLEDAAERTILLLKGMYHSGNWWKQFVEVTVQNLIRQP